MAKHDKKLCLKLRNLCRLNHQLADVIDEAVDQVCGKTKSKKDSSTGADDFAVDLSEAVQNQQSIFTLQLHCIDALGGSAPDVKAKPPKS